MALKDFMKPSVRLLHVHYWNSGYFKNKLVLAVLQMLGLIIA
jgi:hypothetical protein